MQTSSHWQLPLHTRVPEFPHVEAEPAAHGPWYKQADQLDQVPVFVSQIRVAVPQLPQPAVFGPSQTCPVQAASH